MGARERAGFAVGDAAAVVASWAAMLVAENVALGFLFRSQFTAAWELVLERRSVVPLVLLSLAPACVLFGVLWSLAERAARGSSAVRALLAVLGGLAGAALALGISGGRHFASWTLR